MIDSAYQKKIKQVCAINARYFGKDDPYSDFKYVMKELDNENMFCIIIDKHSHLPDTESNSKKNKVLGYLLYYCTDSVLEVLRMGASSKGKGIGQNMVRRALSIADHMGLDFFTYTHRDNLASINCLVRAGCVITKVGKDSYPWVYVENKR